MKIILNDQTINVHNGARVSDLIAELISAHSLSEERGIALAVNFEVVPKSEWGRKVLFEDDQVTLIRATQGG